MTFHWLDSRFGINFLGVGLVATPIAVAIVVFQDVSLLLTGLWPKLSWCPEAYLHLVAAAAAIFWAVSFFAFRSRSPRFVAVVVALSLASYVVQPFTDFHFNQLKAISLARVLGLCTLLLLARTYTLELKTGRVRITRKSL
jgi:hypothetical protein